MLRDYESLPHLVFDGVSSLFGLLLLLFSWRVEDVASTDLNWVACLLEDPAFDICCYLALFHAVALAAALPEFSREECFHQLSVGIRSGLALIFGLA